ncbi:hypothetical protein DLV22_22795 [Shigella boydii]|uniref:Uncharacterized protein n=1 Tax=Shigella boydii TaxID=621 RepID=A0A8H9AIF0_SHIBO|nr:hypothetical protein [Escherichia coli]EGE3747438.1 hypothetical protein [Shigella boydii]EFG9843649.1 hypothetical protein [Escherichia coli]EIT4383348.1 hypothetical protein [Escherichia coli]UMS01284.1 hypothetical protein AOY87_25340 [Escherichia coli]HBC0988781.1 hypothetical protein [Escherichia coli]
MHKQQHPVVLPKLKVLSRIDEQRLTPYQRGMYHGLSEMLEQVKAAMVRADVKYQESKNA